jgi:hypothetical protein
MKYILFLFLTTLVVEPSFSDGGSGVPSIPGTPGSSGGSDAFGFGDAAGSLDAFSSSMDKNYARFETIYEQQIDPTVNRGMDIFEEFTQPHNLFLAAFATTAGTVLGGAIVNGAIAGLGRLTELLTTDWDQVRADIYFDNLEQFFALKNRLEEIDKKYSRAIKYYGLISSVRDNFNKEDIDSMVKEIALTGACKTGRFNQTAFDRLMESGSKVSEYILFPDRLKNQICEFLLLKKSYEGKLENAKSKIISNFDSMAIKEIENFREQQEDRHEARLDSLEKESGELTNARTEFVNCLNNNPLRDSSKFSSASFQDDNGKPIDLIDYWNSRYSTRGEDSEVGAVVSQVDYAKMRRGNLLKMPQGRAPYNMIFKSGPRSSRDIESLSCPIDDSSRIPLIAPLINLFKDRNEECEELRNYFVHSSEGVNYCQKQAEDGFRQAEKKTEELTDKTRGQTGRDVAQRRAEIEQLRRLKDQLASTGYSTRGESDQLISDEWKEFQNSACF